ncbi:hypothetical protein XCR1_860033 [Xenorhabdus cabanillasii JM26]|uniref:Uncharacterized protein n=1 Tax=Xenorhabdus cabanillasii JM26 TaxID=1427517 RepID=W1J943_9GAMM|nr:hypothetical protein XCR1_860033 [Xenorhabdus cabanillasii JM26]
MRTASNPIPRQRLKKRLRCYELEMAVVLARGYCVDWVHGQYPD